MASEDCEHLIYCKQCARNQMRKEFFYCPICGIRINTYVILKLGEKEKFIYKKHGFDFGGLLRSNEYFY